MLKHFSNAPTKAYIYIYICVFFNNLKFTLKHLKRPTSKTKQQLQEHQAKVIKDRSVLSVLNVNFRLLKTIYVLLLVCY